MFHFIIGDRRRYRELLNGRNCISKFGSIQWHLAAYQRIRIFFLMFLLISLSPSQIYRRRIIQKCVSLNTKPNITWKSMDLPNLSAMWIAFILQFLLVVWRDCFFRLSHVHQKTALKWQSLSGWNRRYQSRAIYVPRRSYSRAESIAPAALPQPSCDGEIPLKMESNKNVNK